MEHTIKDLIVLYLHVKIKLLLINLVLFSITGLDNI